MNIIKFVCIFLLLSSIIACKRKENEIDLCLSHKLLAENELIKGNLFYYHKKNYSQSIEYFLFKKYNLVDYLEYYPNSTDSCFINVMNTHMSHTKLLKKNIEQQVDSLINIEQVNLEKYQKFNELLPYNVKYTDGFYSTVGDVIAPTLVYPFDEHRFVKDLLLEVLNNDISFISSSYWILINQKGEVEKIETYKRHSKSVDSIVKKSLLKTKWKPGILKFSEESIITRRIFSVGRRQKS